MIKNIIINFIKNLFGTSPKKHKKYNKNNRYRGNKQRRNYQSKKYQNKNQRNSRSSNQSRGRNKQSNANKNHAGDKKYNNTQNKNNLGYYSNSKQKLKKKALLRAHSKHLKIRHTTNYYHTILILYKLNHNF